MTRFTTSLRLAVAFCITLGLPMAGSALGQQQRNVGGIQQRQQVASGIQQQAPSRRQAGGRSGQTIPLRAPAGFPLTPEHTKHVNELLRYWENSSTQVERLRCEFTRWKYDSTVCNYTDPANRQMVPHEIAKGSIKFEKPDRAVIAIDRKQVALPPNGAQPKLEYREVKGKVVDQHKERFVSSGDAIFIFDYAKKQLIKNTLPPEMKGQGLKNSPLPFFFGAKAADLKSRYWIKSVTPKGVQKQWWLEIYPKRRQDAEFYSKAVVILAGDDFLPKSIQMFSPDFNPKKITLADGQTRPALIRYQIYEFTNPEKNFNRGLAQLWNSDFNPRTPLGWRWVEKKMGTTTQTAARPVGGSPAIRQ